MTWNNELSVVDRLLVILASPVVSDEQRSWVESVFADLDGREQVELAEKVELNDVAPQVLLTLERLELEPELPPEVLAAWNQRRAQVTTRNARRVQEAAGLFRQLAERDVPVILLKGGLFAEVMWRDPGYKKMNDLDVLIRPEHLDVVREVYRDRGYLPLVLFEGTDPDAVRVDKTYHLPSFVSRDLEFVIGTHWGLASPKKKFRLDYPRMWRESFPVSFHGAEVRSLSPEDNLHHLAVHFHHYKTGLKELGDIFAYARHSPPDWAMLERRILAAGTASRAYYAFSLADTLAPLGAPQSFFLALERAADDFSRREVRLRLSRRDLLLRSRSLYESRIEKAFTRYSLETRFHVKLAYFLLFFHLLVFPPRWVLERTNVLDEVSYSSYPRLWFTNLGRTAREVGDGLGYAVFVAVCLKGTVEILASLKHYLWPPSDDPLSKLRRAVDGDEAALHRLMAYLE